MVSRQIQSVIVFYQFIRLKRQGNPLEDQQSARPIVKVPEAEANELMRRLRHDSALSGCGISVYAFVSRSGLPALHVAIDYPEGEGKEGDRYDIKYKAETPVKTLHRNAVKRILSKWAGRS